MKYKKIILGGTFDRLHEGHKSFLRFAFSHADHVIIGLTSDAYIAEKKSAEHVLSFEERKKTLETFLTAEGFSERVTLVPINSAFDQTQLHESEDTALLVSSETYGAGLAVNKKRENNGMQPLPLIVMPIVTAPTGERISSTAIRSGLFDSKGNFLPDAITSSFIIPDSLRNSFHKPFGTLFMQDLPSGLDQTKLVTVGDVTTKRLHDAKIYPKIAVVDFRIERKDTHQNLEELGFTGNEAVIHVQNPSGEIAPNIWADIAELCKQLEKEESFAVVVEGEEDLLVIPLILLLPIGFTILYGQPGEGLVRVDVSEETKKQLLVLLKEYF